MDEIVIRPLQFSWQFEWLPRARSCYPRMREAMKEAAGGERNEAIAAAAAIGLWQKETAAWLASLSAEKKEDVIQLLFAECEMLWEVIDPGYAGASKPQFGGEEWSDFRERFYEGRPLAYLVSSIDEFERRDAALSVWRGLEAYAEEKSWLP